MNSVPRRSSAGAALLVVAVYGAFLLVTNPWVTVFDDEASIVFSASGDARSVVAAVFGERGQHLHPPLYDLFLHAWIAMGGGERAWLRVPSVALYCLAIWLIGATAELLWSRRLLAVLVAVLWPPGFFFGRPAHWLPMAALFLAGTTWAYFRLRQREQRRDAAVFAGFGLGLVYTNYLGFAFLGALGLHLLSTRPSARVFRLGLAAGMAIALGFAPLVPALFSILGGATQLEASLLNRAANGLYLAYSLLPSEAVAPWHWPAAVVGLGIALLAWVAVRTPRVAWLLGLTALVYASAIWLGVLDGKKVGLMGPWVLLCLAGLLAVTEWKRTAVAALALIFVTGWAGIAVRRWVATYRYIEPWQEVAEAVIREARPGDLIVCSHPSFFFYAQDALGESWRDALPETVVTRSRLDFSALGAAQAAVAERPRVIYVRSVVNSYVFDAEREFYQLLSRDLRLVRSSRHLEDDDAELKNRFLGNQPRWRIEVLRYERPSPIE
jgi:hypothetical protein